MKDFAVAIVFFNLFTFYPYKVLIFLLKIWRYHKKALPLHPQNEKIVM